MVQSFPSLPLILCDARKRMLRKKERRTKRVPVTSLEMSNKTRLLSWNEYPGGVILSIQKSKRAKKKPVKNTSSYFSFTFTNIEHWYANIAPLNDQKSSYSCKIERKNFSKNDHTQTFPKMNVNLYFNTKMNIRRFENIVLGIVPNNFPPN